MERAVLIAVCDNIANEMSMREACKQAGVSTKTFCQYLHTDKELSEQYARAKEVRSHAGADRIVSVMDRVEAGELEPDKARVIIDGHKWLLGKWNRRDYGDKQDVALSGSVSYVVETGVPRSED